MRIAICFHGQLRTACHAAPAIKSYLGDLWENCDFFIHTWDVNNYVNPNRNFRDYINILNGIQMENGTDTICSSILKFGGLPVKKMITADEIEFIQKFYQPKFFKVESYEKWVKKHSNLITKNDNFPTYRSPFYYSFFSSVQGKKSFENENGFIYDAVVKLRPDVSFLVNKMPIYKDNKCYLSLNHVNDVYTSYLCHDLINFYKDTTSMYSLENTEILGISSSSIMDTFSKIWQNFELGENVLLTDPYHVFVQEYLIKHNIEIKPTHTSNYAFHRAICQIVPSTDWPLIHLLSFLNDQVNSKQILNLIDDDVKKRLIHYTKSDKFLDMLQQTYGK